MNVLKEGQVVQSIAWPDDTSITVHDDGLETLIVTMEDGQTRLVPWVRATYDTGAVIIHNAAHFASVVLPDQRG